MRSLIFTATAILITSIASQALAQTKTYNLKSGEKLSALPCDAWKKNADGSWTQTADVIYPGNNRVSGNTFRGTTEAKELDAKCGPK
jgi:hypothetical protein